MFKSAIFDFDGVIVDSHPVHNRAWARFLESVGRIASEEELQFISDGRTRDDILRYLLGQLDADEIVAYGHRKEQFFRDEAAEVRMIEGLPSFLENLEEAGLVLGIASSASRGRVDFLLDRLDLKKHFRVVVTGDEVAQGKPDPAVFLKAADGLRTAPAESVAFEDAFSGVKAAKAAGMACVGIAESQRASLLLEAGADHVVTDFRFLSYAMLQQVFFSDVQK